MESKVDGILTEWQEGCFYNTEFLSEAYTVLLLELLEAAPAELHDPRLPGFLKAGYDAYLYEQAGDDPDAKSTYDMALKMVGQGNGDVAVADTHSEGVTNEDPGPGPSGAKRPRDNEEQGGDSPTLEIIQSTERELKRFKAKFREEVMLVKGLGSTLPSEDIMTRMFDSMLARQREAVAAKDDDRVILEVQNLESTDNPLWFSMRQTSQINGRIILDKLTRVLNSNQSFITEGKLRVSYIHVPTPEGGGRNKRRNNNQPFDDWLAEKISKKTIFSPDNEADSMCLTRCVAVAKARKGMSYMAFSRIKKPQSVVQRKEALALCELAGIDPNKRCGLDEVRKLQDKMHDYRLCVFTDRAGRECVFKGPSTQRCENLYLLLHDQHFYAILYPGAAFNKNFTCEKCVVFFEHKGEHKCAGSCWRCLAPDPHDETMSPLVRCPTCYHQFAGNECLQLHKTIQLPNSTLTKCDAFKFCPACDTSYTTLRGRKHMCGFNYCKYCKENVRENHLCFMTSWEEKNKKKDRKCITIYYDIESTQHDSLEGGDEIFVHKPNLLVSQAVCDRCIGVVQNDFFCNVCKTRQHLFHNLDAPNINVISQFIEYLQSFDSKTDILLIAHNAKSYDSVFVLQEVIKRQLQPSLILQGAKIISMKLGNWHFIDSLMFLAMPLSAMPKSFGLNELKKGHWPFLANKPEFYRYVGPLLPKEFYCVDGMKAKAASEFHAWYDALASKHYVFNFRRELFDYCISDVTILRQASEAFRRLFAGLAGFDPMSNAITLSSACMSAFRRNFLPQNKIGIVPAGGYHGGGKQSDIALKWLDYESFKLGHEIQTIYTHREVSVLGRRVDGYVEIPRDDGSVERRIYQFHGDYWHSCPRHFPVTSDSLENRYEKTMHLTALFRRSGFLVIEKWECEFLRDLETDPEVKDYFERHPTTRVPLLNLRDALTGGRTSALRAAYKADLSKGEKIKMVDVQSEYPNANLRGKYPYGHPTIYLQGNPDTPPVNELNGMVKCTILPPSDLYIPVLPYKCNGKLMFPLCKLCVETESRTLDDNDERRWCNHNDRERQLTDTWCAPEIQQAVKHGYTIQEIHEIYQYPGTMAYNPDTGSDGLLSAYIRCFMAVKIQASGWPVGCDSEEDKAKFVADVLKYDGIVIDPEKVEYNAALRTLGKLMANAFWGKFGEKTIRPKTEFIYDYGELMNLVADTKKEICSLIPQSEDCLQVSWKPIDDTDESLPTSSILHAAFTTCLGRLHLYKYLDIVKERALYHDTDSVAYISRPGEPDLPLGTHLGDLTDQIEEEYGPKSYILEFVAGGPKNYAFKVAVGGDPTSVQYCIKVRGVTINRTCDELVTFENLKAMVTGEREKISVPIPRQIARLQNWTIVTRPTSKDWRAKNSKRRRIDVEQTVPHGYNPEDSA